MLPNKQYKPEHYRLSDFDFYLPNNLIAQIPAKQRTQSRLLKVNSNGDFYNKIFNDIADEFISGDVLIINNTKVIPARLFGEKKSGGKLEIFVERILSNKVALCMIKSNRSPKVDSIIYIAKQKAKVINRQGIFFIIKLYHESWDKLTKKEGGIPLPPYINRQTTENDLNRYQTVYANKLGAVAAPTAGLHFDEKLLNKLRKKGVTIAEVTLHVGAGTFLPVKSEDLSQHEMHYELFEITKKTQEIINMAKSEGRRITAVGTTSMRSLESASKNKRIISNGGDTNLFIRPGYSFEIVDRLITNFHLPKSSLMMLVSAFAGYETIKNTYKYAISQNYRFFSYGDAMILDVKNI